MKKSEKKSEEKKQSKKNSWEMSVEAFSADGCLTNLDA